MFDDTDGAYNFASPGNFSLLSSPLAPTSTTSLSLPQARRSYRDYASSSPCPEIGHGPHDFTAYNRLPNHSGLYHPSRNSPGLETGYGTRDSGAYSRVSRQLEESERQQRQLTHEYERLKYGTSTVSISYIC